MNQLFTRWGKEILEKGITEVLQEYPRPMLARKCWQNLNGLWEYAFTDSIELPEKFEGQILVPFSPETELSRVHKQLKPEGCLWYRKSVKLSGEIKMDTSKKEHLWIHFGAVDQSCSVFVNGQEVISHHGGYLPFSVDIAPYLLQDAQEFELTVRVKDVSDTSYHSVGKQSLQPKGMYYTATSGIWQTVWMEKTPESYVETVDFYSDFDGHCVKVVPKIQGEKKTSHVVLHFINGEYEDVSFPASNQEITMQLPDFKKWSPENPYLYQVQVELISEYSTDLVESYFAMRKCTLEKDTDGTPRIFLNGEVCNNVGVLDQGYWPESSYTASCDEAMIFDIQGMKDLGFNMIRKHIKIEPQRWYYHCDRLGMLVWQDMVNGGRKNKAWYVTYLATLMNWIRIRPSDRHSILLSRQDKAGKAEYREEMRETIRILRNHPSIVCYVPFNEGWGQFETNAVTEEIRALDSDRLIDQASGWFDQGGGDFKSLHYYFLKLWYRKESKRALALTEFGGYVHMIPEHSSFEQVYGYKIFTDKKSLSEGYDQLMRDTVYPAVQDGFAATVYTQLSDIEEEVNGIYTYDREVLKIERDVVLEWNRKLRE